MKHLLVVTLALISLQVHATPMCETQVGTALKPNQYRITKQIDAQLASDAQMIRDAQPTYASSPGQIIIGSVQQVGMTTNGVVGESVYAVERIVKAAIDSGDCAYSNLKESELPGGVNCVIQMPGKMITVAIQGSSNIITGITASVITNIPGNILDGAARLFEQLQKDLNPVGAPLVIVSVALRGTQKVLQVVSMVANTTITGSFSTAALVACTPFEGLGQLLKGEVGNATYTLTLGWAENLLKGLAGIAEALPLPPSPCDSGKGGVNNDKLCRQSPQ